MTLCNKLQQKWGMGVFSRDHSTVSGSYHTQSQRFQSLGSQELGQVLCSWFLPNSNCTITENKCS